MVKPIGRIWVNENCISGYIVFGENQTDIVKFACERVDAGNVLVFPSKKGQTEQQVLELAPEVVGAQAPAFSQLLKGGIEMIKITRTKKNATCQICRRIIPAQTLKLVCVVAESHSESCCLSCIPQGRELEEFS